MRYVYPFQIANKTPLIHPKITPMKNLVTKVAIIEDKPDIMKFLVKTLNATEDFEVQGQYTSAEDALTFLPRSDAKIAVVDIGLPGENGIECVRKIKAIRPEMQFMMYTVFDKDNEIFDSLRAGASGYLLKTTIPEKVIDAVRELAAGGAPMSPVIAKRLIEFFFKGPPRIQALDLLSKTEGEVLHLLAQGYLYKEIAEERNIVLGTVKQHIHNIYQKTTRQ